MSGVSGQTPANPHNPANPLPDWVQRNAQKRAELETARRQSEAQTNPAMPDFKARKISKRRRAIRAEEAKRRAAILAPDPEDAARYREFLSRPGTGLFRLIPNFNCQHDFIIYAEGDCANAVSDSWVYSFRLKDHPIKSAFWDIRLDSEELVADGFLSQTIMVSLGDVAPENFSAADPGMKFLADFSPARQVADAREQSAELSRGITSGDHLYSNRLKFAENTTYGLRIIAYRSDDRQSRGAEINKDKTALVVKDDPRFWNLRGDPRSDLTIIFRVVRKEENGGISILWKEISRREGPILNFPQNEDLRDIR
ncbi:MAG: hypothetical protein R2747_23495 [Pyrinomonadaceae bacterium]